VHAILVIDAVAFSFDFVIDLLALKAKAIVAYSTFFATPFFAACSI